MTTSLIKKTVLAALVVVLFSAAGIGNACDADIAVPNDCIVNVLDLAVLRNAFQTQAGDQNWNPAADFDDDGVVSFSDLGILKQSFFSRAGPSGVPNSCST